MISQNFCQINSSFLAWFLRKSHTLLGECSLLLWGVGLSQSNSIVVTVKNRIELSHEYITDEEHFFFDVHFHDCWGTNCLGAVTMSSLSVWVNFSWFVFYLLTVNFSLGINNILWFNLSKNLRSKWSHLELHFLSTLSQVQLLWIKHPLIRCKVVIFSSNNQSQITKLRLVLALYESVSSGDLVLCQTMESKCWNGHEGSSRVKSDHASTWFTCTDVQVLSIHLKIIKFHSEHVLELNVIPVDVSVEFGFVVVAKSKIRHDIVFLLVFYRGQVESKNIALKKFLVDHFIEYWGDSSLSECWVG